LTFKLQPMAVKSTAEVKRTYQSVMHASGLAGRYEACFGIFSSSDGMNFSTTNIYFDSPKQAQRELKNRLKTALEILSREQSVDETGQVVGELVVATFPPSENASTPSAQLLQTKGSDFVSISSSLHNITEYKKDRKPWPRLLDHVEIFRSYSHRARARSKISPYVSITGWRLCF